MKFHPHLHVIAANGFFDKNGLFNPCDISFDTKFSKAWRREVIENLSISNFRIYQYGFHVWNDTKLLNKGNSLTKYMSRYVRHPAIANSRIINCTKENVIFFYKDYNKNKIVVKEQVFDFISSLIQHIPPEQFKMIRHYGAYSRNQRKNYWHYFK